MMMLKLLRTFRGTTLQVHVRQAAGLRCESAKLSTNGFLNTCTGTFPKALAIGWSDSGSGVPKAPAIHVGGSDNGSGTGTFPKAAGTGGSDSSSSAGGTVRKALVIGGSDSSSGAGIQADLKTTSSLGVYCCTVITALTAQNTRGYVIDAKEVDCAFVKTQLESVFTQDVAAVKVGMLHTREVVDAVIEALEEQPVQHLVIDPVINSTTGYRLLKKDAYDRLRKELIPRADLITPTIFQAIKLLDWKADPEQLLKDLKPNMLIGMLKELMSLGTKSILLKGGRYIKDGKENEDTVDLYYTNSKELISFKSKWVRTKYQHGTGTILSSAITAYLARGFTMYESVFKAKQYVDKVMEEVNKYKLHNVPVHKFLEAADHLKHDYGRHDKLESFDQLHGLSYGSRST